MIHPQRPTGSWSATSISERLRTTGGQISACFCGRDIFVQVVIWWFDQTGVRAGRTKEKEREREINTAHHFTWRPRPVTFWADCTAARSGTVRLPLQSASYCNTPPHLYPSRISTWVPFFAVVAVVVFSAVLPASLLSPLPSARSRFFVNPARALPSQSFSLSLWRAVLRDLDGSVPLVLRPLVTSRGVNVKIICFFSRRRYKEDKAMSRTMWDGERERECMRMMESERKII